MVAESYRPVGAVTISKEGVAGDYAAFAVDFAESVGIRRRGLLGLRRDDAGWQPWARSMGGHYVGDEPAGFLWTTSGGWSTSDIEETAVFGGWVGDPAAASVRITDVTGRRLEDAVENGVVLFLYRGGFQLHGARVELRDAGGDVIREGING